MIENLSTAGGLFFRLANSPMIINKLLISDSDFAVESNIYCETCFERVFTVVPILFSFRACNTQFSDTFSVVPVYLN